MKKVIIAITLILSASCSKHKEIDLKKHQKTIDYLNKEYAKLDDRYDVLKNKILNSIRNANWTEMYKYNDSIQKDAVEMDKIIKQIKYHKQIINNN